MFIPAALLTHALARVALAQDTLTFAVVGDTQTDGTYDSINWDVVPGIVEGANALGAEYLLVAGDLVGGSGSLTETVRQWEDFRTATALFDGPVYVVPGNHDVYGGAGTFDAWRSTFPELPQDDAPEGEEGVSYVVDHGNTRFIVVTSDHPSNAYALSSAGLGWLAEKLEDRADFDHVFVVTHHPVSFSDASGHGGTGGDFWRLLVANDVTGLFVGHWHRYQPGQLGAGGETWETILGTGGGWQGYAPIRPYQQVHGFVLVQVDGAEATATFYADDDGDGAYDDPLDAFTMASAVPPAPGLLARYTFDDGTADDSAPSGKAIHGSLEGGASVSDTADGPSGAWLDLSGAADYVEAGSIGDYVLALHGDLSLSTWVRVDGTPTDASWGDTLLCYATNDYYSEDEETNYSWWLSVLPDGELLAFWEHDSGSNETARSTVSSGLLDGGWHHVAMVRDAESSAVRFYVDGVQLGDDVPYDTAPTGGARGMLYMGSDTPEYAGSYDLDGALDEVCIFDAALDAEQIAALGALTDCEDVVGGGGDTGGGDTGSTGGDTATEDSGSATDAGGDDTGQADGGGTDDGGVDGPGGTDTGTGGGGEGCGCAAAAATGSSWALWVGLGLALGRVRRRSAGDVRG